MNRRSRRPLPGVKAHFADIARASVTDAQDPAASGHAGADEFMRATTTRPDSERAPKLPVSVTER